MARGVGRAERKQCASSQGAGDLDQSLHRLEHALGARLVTGSALRLTSAMRLGPPEIVRAPSIRPRPISQGTELMNG